MIGSISKIRPCAHNHHFKYSHCKTISDLKHIGDYKNDGDSQFKFDFNLDNITNLNSGFQTGNVISLDIKLPKATNIQSLCFNNSKIQYITLEAPLIDNLWGVIYHAWSVKDFQMDMTKIKVLGYFAETANSISDWRGRNFENAHDLAYAFFSNIGIVKKIFDSDFSAIVSGRLAFTNIILEDIKYPVDEDGICIYKSKKPQAIIDNIPQTKFITLPNLENGDEMFNHSIFSAEASLSILNSLPTWTDNKVHRFQIGIHIDNKYNPEVNLAIKKCQKSFITPIEEYGGSLSEIVENDKGWTLTISWRGTATSDAYPPPSLSGDE